MAVRGHVRQRDLRVLAPAILSAAGDGVALVALGLAAKNMAGQGMGGGIAVSALFAPLHERVDSRRPRLHGGRARRREHRDRGRLERPDDRQLVGSNVIARRVTLAGLGTATLVGVVVQGLGKFVAPFWLLFGFMVVAYFVGGMGHGLKNVALRTLIRSRIAPERHGRAFAAWNGIRNAAELGALAVGGIVVGAIGARSTLWLAGGLSALAGVIGLLVLASWRGRAPEPVVGASTIGSP
jgi:Major Facilitator Superfamily